MKHIFFFIIKFLLRNIFYLFPISKTPKIVFINFNGRGYGDNPKYLADEFIRQKLPYKLVWLAKKHTYVPNTIKNIKYNSIGALYQLATAQIIISNTKSLSALCKKKKSQFYLQTWHGNFGCKYIEKEIEGFLSPEYVKTSKADSQITNAIISGNTFFAKILKESFWLPETCKILECGVPRNDIYFKDYNYRKVLKSKYSFSEKDKILLYAPTFRDNYNTDCYDIDSVKIRELLCRKIPANWKIVIRLHPNVAKQADLFTYNDDIINGSDFPDPQELCFISDCLITDYSSIMSDFMLMKKPVFLYCPDLEKYADKSQGRGLRDIFWKLPFSMGKSQAELLQQISSFDNKNYLGKLAEFMQKEYVSFDDGHASEKVVNYIKEKMTK